MVGRVPLLARARAGGARLREVRRKQEVAHIDESSAPKGEEEGGARRVVLPGGRGHEEA